MGVFLAQAGAHPPRALTHQSRFVEHQSEHLHTPGRAARGALAAREP